MTDQDYTDLTINDYTDDVMDTALYGDILDPENPADIEKTINFSLSQRQARFLAAVKMQNSIFHLSALANQ